jgi:hypothetical protein
VLDFSFCGWGKGITPPNNNGATLNVFVAAAVRCNSEGSGHEKAGTTGKDPAR